MVDELDDVFESGGTPESEGIFEPNGISESDGISNPKPKQLKWNIISKGKYLKNYATKHGEAIISRTHDTMAFGGGSSMMKALMWKFMGECYFKDRVRLMDLFLICNQTNHCSTNRVPSIHQTMGVHGVC